MQEVVKVTRGGKVPFWMMADWTWEPQRLRDSEWFRVLDAVIILPQNTHATCWSSQNGSMLDCMIASRSLVPMILLRALDAVPWSPHSALYFTFDVEPMGMARSSSLWTIGSSSTRPPCAQ